MVELERNTIGTNNKLGKYLKEDEYTTKCKISPKELTICFVVKNRSGRIVDNCLKSLRNQSNEINIIIYDLGSTWNKQKKIKKFCKKYDADFYFHKLKDFNKPIGMTLATLEVKTKYIGYSDIDLIFESNFVEVVLKALNSRKKPFILSKVKRLDFVPKNIKNFKNLNKKSILKNNDSRFGYGGFLATTKKCIETTTGMDIDIPTDGHAQELYIRALSKGYQEMWIDNYTNMLHQNHEFNKKRLEGREYRISLVKNNISWYTDKRISKFKKLASNPITNNHAKWIHNNKYFLPHSDTTKRISYILGLRNKDLKLARKSLLMLSKQNYKNLEFIIIDYGSEDDYTEKLFEKVKYYLKDKNFKYFKVKANKWSRSQALNTGLLLSNSEYVCFIDGDIVINEDFSEKLSGFLNKNDIISFTVRKIDNPKVRKYFENSEIYKYGLGMSAGHRDSYIIIGGFDERMEGWGSEDNDIIKRLSKIGKNIISVYPHCIMYHLEHETNRTGKRRNKKIMDDFKINKFKFIKNKSIKEIYPKNKEFKLFKDYNMSNKPSIPDFEPLSSDIKSFPKTIILNLLNNGIKVCLLKKTCYEAVVDFSISDKELHLGVTDVYKAKKIIDDKRVYFYEIPNKTKKWNISNLTLEVPSPVINYLERQGYDDIKARLKKQGRL